MDSVRRVSQEVQRRVESVVVMCDAVDCSLASCELASCACSLACILARMSVEKYRQSYHQDGEIRKPVP